MDKRIIILGSTGSIGTQTLEVVREQEGLKVVALAAGNNVDLMEKQVREFVPAYVCMYNPEAAEELRNRIGDTFTQVLSGMDGLLWLASYKEYDVLVTAIVGMIGIRPTITAIENGKDIALANKETLVTAGHIIMPLAKEKNVKILPVDSEHSAIFQSLQGNPEKRVAKILLTASGGPFRGLSFDEMYHKCPEDALKHPNWSMGQKITIDSASMVNKGLEVMEAKWLFDVSYEQIEVLVHPQSIVHSMVEYVDGAVIGQFGVPDMKLPIQYALFYPDRRPAGGEKLDLAKVGTLTFAKPDLNAFKGLYLGIKAGKMGGSMPTVYNAANEKAVALFLKKKISFGQIPELIEQCMQAHTRIDNPSLDEILQVEQSVYQKIDTMIE